MLSDYKRLQHKTFRKLILYLPFSFLYDLFWLLFSGGSLGHLEDPESSDHTVKVFSYYMSLVSMFFRVIVIGVFAKASADFRIIIKS
jgi:hypothetical protein